MVSNTSGGFSFFSPVSAVYSVSASGFEFAESDDDPPYQERFPHGEYTTVEYGPIDDTCPRIDVNPLEQYSLIGRVDLILVHNLLNDTFFVHACRQPEAYARAVSPGVEPGEAPARGFRGPLRFV